MPSIVAPPRTIDRRRLPAIRAEARPPGSSAAARTTARASRVPAGATGSPRILVVDDEASIRMLCTINLGLEGYDVEQAEDGGRALELIGRSHFDLVLLDVMLPDIGGFEIARRVVAGHTPAPIVFLSARADPADLRAGYEAGGLDYITKPFDPTSLATRVREVLDRIDRGESERYRQARLTELGGW